MKDIFTFYWCDGRKHVIRADAVETAFGRLGFGGGALAAVDHYAKNSDARYWDAEKRDWVEREQCMHVELNSNVSVDEQESTLVDSFTRALKISNEVVFTRPDKDQILLRREMGEYAKVGQVTDYMVSYGEYCPGGYGEDDPMDHHFMAIGTIHFDLRDATKAVEAAVQYALRGPASRRTIAAAKTLDEIAEALDGGFAILEQC